jgi:hypothetical protein
MFMCSVATANKVEPVITQDESEQHACADLHKRGDARVHALVARALCCGARPRGVQVAAPLRVRALRQRRQLRRRRAAEPLA